MSSEQGRDDVGGPDGYDRWAAKPERKKLSPEAFERAWKHELALTRDPPSIAGRALPPVAVQNARRILGLALDGSEDPKPEPPKEKGARR